MPAVSRAHNLSRLCLACALIALISACDRSQSRPGEALIPVRELGGVGLEPGLFNYPRAMDGGLGSLWVIDKSARVQRLDPETGHCIAWFFMPEFDRGMPTGITIAPFLDGSPALYIADTHEHRVLVFAPPESADEPPPLLASFGDFGEGPGQFIFPTDVAVLEDDSGRPVRIFVSEYGGNDRISVFDARRTLRGEDGFLFSFGSQGAGDGPVFDRPQSLAIDPTRDELIVCDAINHRIGRFTLDGDLVRWLDGRRADGTGGLDYPYGLLMLADGRVLISQFGASRIALMDLETGVIEREYGVPGRGPGELSTPWALCALDGLCFVLDSGNNRIQAFRPWGVSPRLLHDGDETP